MNNDPNARRSVAAILTAALAASTAVALAGCGGRDSSNDVVPGETSAADVAEDASEAASTAAEYASEQYAAFKSTMSDQIEGVNDQIDSLRAKAADASAATKAQIQAAIAALETQRDALLEQLDNAADTTSDAWDDVQSGLSEAWGALKTAANDAVERFDG